MARHSSLLGLYRAQLQRFDRLRLDMRQGHEDIAEGGLRDQLEFTRGGIGPSGHARKKWLRQLGHPFGRGINSAASTRGGLKRQVSRQAKQRAGFRGRSFVPSLPIGSISGRLRRGIQKRQVPNMGVQSFDVGTTKAAGRSAWVLSPAGTQRMVGRGVWPEVKKRFRARNKSFVDHFKGQQRKP